MIRQLTLAVVLASIPISASAKEYGDPGTIEVGGDIALTNGNTKYKPDGGTTDTETYTLVTISPTAGYFVSDGFAVLGKLSLGSNADKFTGSDKTSATTFAIDAGAGYYVKAGTMRVGPDVLVGFTSENDDNGGGDKTTLTGPEVLIGGTLKSPVGKASGGVVGLGLHYDYRALDYTDKSGGASTKLTETVGVLSVDVGFTVFF